MLVTNNKGEQLSVEYAFAVELKSGWLCDDDNKIASLEEKVQDLTLMVGMLIGMVNLSEDDLGRLIGHEWEKVSE